MRSRCAPEKVIAEPVTLLAPSAVQSLYPLLLGYSQGPAQCVSVSATTASGRRGPPRIHRLCNPVNPAPCAVRAGRDSHHVRPPSEGSVEWFERRQRNRQETLHPDRRASEARPGHRSLAVLRGPPPRYAHSSRPRYTAPPKDVVKLFGVQLFSAARHHTERCSGSEGLFGDLIPHLKSSGDFGAVIGGSHTAPRWAEVRGNPTERGQKPLR